MSRVITWNVGGAKYLQLPPDQREEFRHQLAAALEQIVQDQDPDIVLLQEIVQFQRSGQDSERRDLIIPPDGYNFAASIAIDTENQSHPTKWSKYRNGGHWNNTDYLGQGTGILWRNTLAHGPLWEFTADTGENLQSEVIRLDTGLFTGTRDTEPRLAVVSRFTLNQDNRPVDLLVVNLHLTTLEGEREGSPKIDSDASESRQNQLRTVLNGIVSRYNEWANFQRQATPDPDSGQLRPSAIWILAGDYNCIPGARELAYLESLNFVNLNPDSGPTKGSGIPVTQATITLDYIFAGPAYHAFDHQIALSQAHKNPGVLDSIKVSDHLPVCAEVPTASQ